MKCRTIVSILVMVFGISQGAYSENGAGNKTMHSVNGMHEFIHNGRHRSYYLYLPPRYSKSKSLPLVIALHGGGGSAKKWPAYTNRGFERLARKESFILVYPEGLKGNWNDERDYPSSYAHTNDIDDVGFLTALIDSLVEMYSVDKNRVYVTGASNGGMMTHYLAGMASDRIAAIATVISSIPRNLVGTLHPGAPVSVLMINGTEDPLVPWEGGMVKFGRRENGYVISVEDTVRFWVGHDGCDSEPKLTELPDRDTRDGTTIVKTEYSGGAQHTEVVLYSVVGGGHTWPSDKDKRGLVQKVVASKLVGRKSADIDASEVIWEFFKTHPR